MNSCYTCLSSCFTPLSILENSQDKKPVVSGALVFLHQENSTQSNEKSDAVNATQIPTNISPENRLIFVSRVQSIEISPQKNSELLKIPIPIDEVQSKDPKFQFYFESPIPIKETLRQVQSKSLIKEVQMLDQRQNWTQSVWDIPPSTSTTPLPYQQINSETNKEPSPPPEQIVFGAGFMMGPPHSNQLNLQKKSAVEISQSPSQIDKSIQNESRHPSPAPNPTATGVDSPTIRYLLV